MRNRDGGGVSIEESLAALAHEIRSCCKYVRTAEVQMFAPENATAEWKLLEKYDFVCLCTYQWSACNFIFLICFVLSA